MKSSRWMRAEYTSKVAGVIFITLGLYLFFYTPHQNAALGALFIGIITMVLLHRPSVEESTAVRSLECDVLPLENLLEDLELRGNGIVVPPQRSLTSPRLYLPSEETDELPELYDEMTLISGGKKAGVSIRPPGLPLVKEAEERAEYELSGEGIEGAREFIGILTHGLGLASSSSLREEDGMYRLRITHGKYWDYCEKMREESSDICTRTACPLCSAYITAVALSMEQPLLISDMEMEDRHVKYTLEVF